MLVPSYQPDFIEHIYCPVVLMIMILLYAMLLLILSKNEVKNMLNRLRERTRRMEEAIQEQNRRQQETVNQIIQERNKRETTFRGGTRFTKTK